MGFPLGTCPVSCRQPVGLDVCQAWSCRAAPHQGKSRSVSPSCPGQCKGQDTSTLAASKPQLLPSCDPTGTSGIVLPCLSQEGPWAGIPELWGHGPPAVSLGTGTDTATGARAGNLSAGTQRVPLPGECVAPAGQEGLTGVPVVFQGIADMGFMVGHP